jgi:hypothetical protein
MTATATMSATGSAIGGAEDFIKERAAARTRWSDSPESKTFDKWLVGISIVTVTFAGVFAVPNPINKIDPGQTSGQVTAVLLLSLIFAAFAFSTYTTKTSLRQRVEDRHLLGIAASLSDEENKLAENGTDFDTLWKITQRRIRYYHEIATGQARSSFRNGQIAAYTGFAVVIGVAAIAGFTSNGTGAIAASVIGVAGAGLSAYIGSTFMRAQAAASESLREYFLQPVEFSRVLAAERLIETLPEDQRSEHVGTVIRAMIRNDQSKSD